MMSSQGYQPSAGMTSSVRPMSEQEGNAIKAVPKPLRNNAIGMSAVAMLMAVMVNFVDEPVALIMPPFFSFIGLGMAIQARKSSSAATQAVSKGTVTDVRGMPRYKGASGWDFGVFSLAKDGQLKGVLTDGVPATVSLVPEAKRVLSVNGTVLRKPVEVRAAPGFDAILASYAVPQPARVAPVAQEVPQDDLPPPPEDWVQRFCPDCGHAVSEDFMFCRKCGRKLKA